MHRDRGNSGNNLMVDMFQVPGRSAHTSSWAWMNMMVLNFPTRSRRFCRLNDPTMRLHAWLFLDRYQEDLLVP